MFFILGLDFPIHATYIIILIGILTNIYLQYRIKATQLKDLYSSLFLIFDLFQLGLLLYLTGGIHNPFTFLLIIPAIVSSTFLSMGTTIILGLLTLAVLILITFFHLPLPGTEEPLKFPEYYLIRNHNIDKYRVNFFKLFWDKIFRRDKKEIRSTE